MPNECDHPNLRFYDNGKSIHCITCMRAWIAHEFYPPRFEYVGQFPEVEDNKIYGDTRIRRSREARSEGILP